MWPVAVDREVDHRGVARIADDRPPTKRFEGLADTRFRAVFVADPSSKRATRTAVSRSPRRCCR
jgi:hypothetical protein